MTLPQGLAQGVWTLDLAHSEIGFTVRHLMISKVRGRFTKWSGDIQLDDQDLSNSQLTVRIDAGTEGRLRIMGANPFFL